MEFDFGSLNWIAVLVSIIVGQIVSTVWFVVLFGEPWAKAYGAESKQQHTSEVPPYTYGMGLVSTIVLTLSIALLQQSLSVNTLSGGISLGVFLAIGFCCATMLPGQAFLKRYPVFLIAAGSQTAMILAISTLLSVWK